jgi:hypothetical protein
MVESLPTVSISSLIAFSAASMTGWTWWVVSLNFPNIAKTHGVLLVWNELERESTARLDLVSPGFGALL